MKRGEIVWNGKTTKSPFSYRFHSVSHICILPTTCNLPGVLPSATSSDFLVNNERHSELNHHSRSLTNTWTSPTESARCTTAVCPSDCTERMSNEAQSQQSDTVSTTRSACRQSKLQVILLEEEYYSVSMEACKVLKHA